MRYRIAILLLLCTSIAATAQTLEARFQAKLDSVYAANKGAVGIVIHVEAPDTSISWSAAAGFASIAPRVALKPEQPVLLASNTKTYVAAAILRLVEDKRLKLDQPIDKLLSEKTRELLKGDGYDLRAITVRHLLSHTSGVHDYVNDDYFTFVGSQPRYRWTRDEQLQRAVDVGSPLAPAGTKFQYADANYLLLTEIMDELLGGRFQRNMRYLLRFESLGIDHTWFKDLEPRPAGTAYMAHQYSGERGWDSYDLNPHWDMYGGGGLASTAKDAALFYTRLFNGDIIEDEKLLEQMTTKALPEEGNYGLGVNILEFDGAPAYYHGGWWGTDVIYYPNTNTSVAVFTLQKDVRQAVNPVLSAAIQGIMLEVLGE